MTYLKLNWQGRPHHTPRIRVSSNSSSASNGSLPRRAAEQLARHPLSSSLISIRRTQGALSRRSKAINASSPRRRKASLQDGENSKAFRRPLSIHTEDIFLPGIRKSSLISLSPFEARPASLPNPAAPHYSTIPSTDGACLSVFRQRNHSCTVVAKSTFIPVSRSLTERSLFNSAQRHHRRIIRHSHSISPKNTSHQHKVYSGDRLIKRHKTYDSRIAQIRIGDKPKSAGSAISTKPGRPPNRISKRRSRGGNDLDADKLSAAMEQSSNEHPSTQGNNNNSKPFISLSRSTSETKRLKKFQKELERYLCQHKDLPQQTLPSSSATLMSTHTIKELEPFKSEFKAAGLAVTSDEQRGVVSGELRRSKGPNVLRKSQSTVVREGRSKLAETPPTEPSQSLESTGTTVLAFTPPHAEVDGQVPHFGRQAAEGELQLEEENVSPTSRSNIPTKKRLPWLRNIKSPPVQPSCLVKLPEQEPVPSTVKPVQNLGLSEPHSSCQIITAPLDNGPQERTKSILSNHILMVRMASQGTKLRAPSSLDASAVGNTPVVDSSKLPSTTHLVGAQGFGDRISVRTPLPTEVNKPLLLKESMCVAGIQPVDNNRVSVCDLIVTKASSLDQSHQVLQQKYRQNIVNGIRSHANVETQTLRDKKLTPPSRLSHGSTHHICEMDSPGEVTERDDASIDYFPDERKFTLSGRTELSGPTSSDCDSSIMYQRRTLSRSKPAIVPARQHCPAIDPIKRSLPRSPITVKHRRRRNVPKSRPRTSSQFLLTPYSRRATMSTLQTQREVISDKAVFRGLQVATAAACDEDVDRWIEEILGSGVRKLLADISVFERLGVNALSSVARRAARQRREELRKWEAARKQQQDSRIRTNHYVDERAMNSNKRPSRS